MPSLIPENLAQPGIHALIVGVSSYLHFADGPQPTLDGEKIHMEQLSTAARSASEFASWILNKHTCSNKPLNSLRVLLSPSENEVISQDILNLLHGDFSATRANVERELNEFKHACDLNIQNVCVVYVAGHGVEITKHSAIVLLNDFGANNSTTIFSGAIDMAGVHAGMNHPKTARIQFWFVDACRQSPDIADQFESFKGALTLDERRGSTYSAPMFLSAVTGTEAFARIGGVTLFNEALMWAVQGNVAEGPKDKVNKWHISSTSLVKYLPDRVKTLAEAEGVDQTVDIVAPIKETIFHEYAIAPEVDLNIDLAPDEARAVSRGWLTFNASVPIVENYDEWPLHKSVNAGLYLLDIKTAEPYKSKKDILQLEPPQKYCGYDLTN